MRALIIIDIRSRELHSTDALTWMCALAHCTMAVPMQGSVCRQ
jgi:hypothetical protein